MSTAKKELTNRAGGRVIFTQTAADTDGELLEMEATYPPHSEQPPTHYHPYQEEQFEVRQGEFRTNINGVVQDYHPGDRFSVPMNTPHWMYNAGDTEGKLIWQVRPALKTQAFFETMWGLDADGKTNDQGVPNLLQLAVIMQAFADEFRATNPPYWLQQILFAVLAPIGRMMGYQAQYPQSSESDN